ncbi:MAG: hypothetical protein ACI9KE_000804 [Polyangiales bacterium]|jgi:hypothetical protein
MTGSGLAESDLSAGAFGCAVDDAPGCTRRAIRVASARVATADQECVRVVAVLDRRLASVVVPAVFRGAAHLVGWAIAPFVAVGVEDRALFAWQVEGLAQWVRTVGAIGDAADVSAVQPFHARVFAAQPCNGLHIANDARVRAAGRQHKYRQSERKEGSSCHEVKLAARLLPASRRGKKPYPSGIQCSLLI